MKKFAIYKNDFGYFKIEYVDEVVTFLKKVNSEIDDFGEKDKFTDFVFSQIEEYIRGERKEFTFKYKLIGTEFQIKVWNALCDIPYGETRSYKDIAIAIDNYKASRAVGMANNKNPITIVVPCHRVIGSSGKLVGYAGGVDMKEYLLTMEKENK